VLAPQRERGVLRLVVEQRLVVRVPERARHVVRWRAELALARRIM
jgi:hypothetical protein